MKSSFKEGMQATNSHCVQARQVLSKSFCVQYLSLGPGPHQLESHQTRIDRQLHAASGDRIILVLVGTYIFIQKRNNISFQQDTYSVHKKRNLIKAMMAVPIDIEDIFWPYQG